LSEAEITKMKTLYEFEDSNGAHHRNQYHYNGGYGGFGGHGGHGNYGGYGVHPNAAGHLPW
jgi:hypothetical protein